MKKVLPKIFLCIVLTCVLFAALLFARDNIGVSADNIESDIRLSQKIKDDWTVDGDVGNNAAAFISYPKSKSDHTFSVYVRHSGLSFGYFFRAGGSVSEVDEGIAAFTVNDCNERAFISMNKQKVDRIEIRESESIDIDSNKPFAVVLPVNSGSITFYDVNGNTVEYYNLSM